MRKFSKLLQIIIQEKIYSLLTSMQNHPPVDKLEHTIFNRVPAD